MPSIGALLPYAPVRASRQHTSASFLHAAHGFLPQRQTTGSHATAPAALRPLPLQGRGPATERARCAPAFGRRGATHPSSPRPPGPRAVSQVLCGELPKSIIVPRASCTKASHLAIYVISDHIAALSAARLYFAPVLRSTTALIAPVHHNQ